MTENHRQNIIYSSILKCYLRCIYFNGLLCLIGSSSAAFHKERETTGAEPETCSQDELPSLCLRLFSPAGFWRAEYLKNMRLSSVSSTRSLETTPHSSNWIENVLKRKNEVGCVYLKTPHFFLIRVNCGLSKQVLNLHDAILSVYCANFA